MKEVVIVSAVRTPIGSFMGSLSSVDAPKLGAIAIKGALEKINLDPNLIDEVLMGQVVQAGTGQAPARQAAIFAGIPNTVPCTTVNKVCSSGMKTIMQAAQSIALGDAEIIVAGGMENMSQIPHYYHARTGKKFGPVQMEDGMQKDGLVDAYNKEAMGVCADACATEYGFSREDQDTFAIQSYKRSAAAWNSGKFSNEVVPVEVPQRRGEPITVTTDEVAAAFCAVHRAHPLEPCGSLAGVWHRACGDTATRRDHGRRHRATRRTTGHQDRRTAQRHPRQRPRVDHRADRVDQRPWLRGEGLAHRVNPRKPARRTGLCAGDRRPEVRLPKI